MLDLLLQRNPELPGAAALEIRTGKLDAILARGAGRYLQRFARRLEDIENADLARVLQKVKSPAWSPEGGDNACLSQFEEYLLKEFGRYFLILGDDVESQRILPAGSGRKGEDRLQRIDSSIRGAHFVFPF